jgi:carbon-monoxide dehydrogenase large subunit
VSINHARDVSCSIEWPVAATAQFSDCAESIGDIGAYARPSITNTVRIVAQFLSGPYRIPNIHAILGRLSNKTPAGVFRGPVVSNVVLLRADARHHRPGTVIDRVAIRRKQSITAQEMPYPLATTAPDDGLRRRHATVATTRRRSSIACASSAGPTRPRWTAS